jgi:predicted metal-binding membrane protein
LNSPLARLGTDRLLILASLVLLTLIAWAYLWILTAAMERGDMSLMGMESISMDQPMEQPMDPHSVPLVAAMPIPWDATTFVLMFVMWFVMMIGMMVPSALPMILLHARVQRHHRADNVAFRFSALFTAGYLAAWAAFSVVATTMQWGLNSGALLSPMTMSVGTVFGAALFAAAGLYQLSPLKDVCLRHCRSPAEFLALHQRPGLAGAFFAGAHHGLYCVGCCWLLMALLFAGGVMNLAWVAALAILVLTEKLLPHGRWLARASGIAMLIVAAALWLSA